jgi:hypothetical protein
MGFLEVAANRGSAFQLLGAGKGSEVNVVMEERREAMPASSSSKA